MVVIVTDSLIAEVRDPHIKRQRIWRVDAEEDHAMRLWASTSKAARPQTREQQQGYRNAINARARPCRSCTVGDRATRAGIAQTSALDTRSPRDRGVSPDRLRLGMPGFFATLVSLCGRHEMTI